MKFCQDCGSKVTGLNTNSYGCGGIGSMEVCLQCGTVWRQESGGMLPTPGGEQYSRNGTWDEMQGHLAQYLRPHQNKDQAWYFWDLLYDQHGPYESEEQAKREIKNRAIKLKKVHCYSCDLNKPATEACGYCHRCSDCGGCFGFCKTGPLQIEEEAPEPTVDLTDFHQAWLWLRQHPTFFKEKRPGFKESLDIAVVKVNSKTLVAIGRNKDEVESKTQVWLECGPWKTIGYGKSDKVDVPGHDIELDCGADTFELAIIELASLVHKKHGDYFQKKH